MFKKNTFLKTLKRFGEDQGGNVLMITGLAAFAVFSCAGAAIDYSRISNTKSKMTNALDAAVLAAGKELTDGETDTTKLRAKFEDFFYANIIGAGQNQQAFRIAKFEADADTGEVSAKVERDLDMTIMRFAGYDEYTIEAESTGVFDQTDVEVAMMLDVTGSMGGQKIADLKLAAQDAVNILLPKGKTPRVRIGLVPYASSINAGKTFANKVTGGNLPTVASAGLFTINNNVPTNDCVTGRGGAEAFTDASYKTAPLGSDHRTVEGDRAYKRCPKASVQPLTDDRDTLIKQIKKYRAEGFTAGHLGVAWSYYLLSENWRPLYKTVNKPAKYSDDVQKIAILMTDGEFNTAYEGIGGRPFGGNVNQSNDRAKALCENMKKQKSSNPGIIIYSVAFKAPKTAEKTLRECANKDTATTTYYYSADNGAELRTAFQEIAASISNLRISR